MEDIRREWIARGIITEDVKASPPPETDPKQLIRQQRMETFRKFCPAQFQAKIDRTLIPNLEAWDKADAWHGSFPGLWLWSNDTGEAKTRMLWRKFGQMHVECGKAVLRVSGLNLAENYHDCHNRNRSGQFYADLTAFQVVMLDDLDKMPLPQIQQGFSEQANADRNGRMIRELFNRFYENKTVVLVTANEDIRWFGERIGESAERRMREVCAEIAF
jgi:hypothetical protein